MATKPAIVTKKQLEDSGFDNLRDYLNAERGLTRRDGQVAVRKGEMDIKSPAEKRSATRMADVAAQKPSAERRGDTRLRDSQSASASSNDANMLLVDSNNKDDKQAERMSSYGSRSSSKLSDVTRPGTNTNYENKDVSDMSMKRGGKVSSASKRADGIAQRGKTRA